MLTIPSQLTEEMLHACSWCNKFRVPDGTWKEFEDAVPELGLVGIAETPDVSHGICMECYNHITRLF